MEYYLYFRIDNHGALAVKRRVFSSADLAGRLAERYNRLHQNVQILSVQNALTERCVWRENPVEPA